MGGLGPGRGGVRVQRISRAQGRGARATGVLSPVQVRPNGVHGPADCGAAALPCPAPHTPLPQCSRHPVFSRSGSDCSRVGVSTNSPGRVPCAPFSVIARALVGVVVVVGAPQALRRAVCHSCGSGRGYVCTTRRQRVSAIDEGEAASGGSERAGDSLQRPFPSPASARVASPMRPSAAFLIGSSLPQRASCQTSAPTMPCLDIRRALDFL